MTDQIRVELTNINELQRRLAKASGGLDAVIEAAVEAVAEIVDNTATPNAPGDGSGVVHKIVERKKGRVMAHVGPDQKHWYYRFQERGAQPHEVVPKKALALLGGFDTDSGFSAKSDHPGIPAKPFLKPAAKDAQPEAETKAKQIFKRGVENGG